MLLFLYLPLLIVALCVDGICGINVSFHPPDPEVFVDQQLQVEVIFQGSVEELQQIRQSNLSVAFEPPSILSAHFQPSSIHCDYGLVYCNGSLEIEGHFLGFGKVVLLLKNAVSWIEVNPPLMVTVLRQDKVINKVFTAFVATVVSINYINMGCALDLAVVMDVLRKPIGPAIGFFCQFVVMPLVAYGVGLLILDDPVLRLGLFTFGSSPGGGASNMWTVLLGGNLNLSITMTFVSTVAALGTLPLWLFTLGKTILKGTNVVIPFSNILMSLASLTIPIAVGICIQKRFPKMAARSKRILAPVCIVLLIAIIVLASIANSYIFYMLTWRMVIAASLSVWTGFIVGVLISWIFRFPCCDIVAVSVETGIQNSGIAFLLLSYSLKAPVSEMAAVVPVAGSIITPVPLFIVYCCQRFRNCCFRKENFELQAINAKSHSSVKGIDNPGQFDMNY